MLFLQKYKIDCRVTIELLDNESDDTEKSVANQQAWSNYTERYVNPAAGPSTITNPSGRRGSAGAAIGGGGGGGNAGSSATSVTAGGVGGNGATNKVEIKTEKDEDLVSR